MRFMLLNALTVLALACSPSTTPTVANGPLPEPVAAAESAPADAAVAAAVFGGGCFWCVEGVFDQLAGVTEVVSGYAGGAARDANYKAVSAGRTAHAEVVRIAYDPARLSYGDLLRVFFATHDPTTLHRQGPDAGPQYRSVIFHTTAAQQAQARAYIDQLNASGRFSNPIVTTVEPLDAFYPAEAEHQKFVARNPDHGYVRAWFPSKLEKLRRAYADLLKPAP